MQLTKMVHLFPKNNMFFNGFSDGVFNEIYAYCDNLLRKSYKIS
jgi:hypothetical protein